MKKNNAKVLVVIIKCVCNMHLYDYVRHIAIGKRGGGDVTLTMPYNLLAAP